MTVRQEILNRLESLLPASVDLVDESAAHAGHAGAAPSGETHWRIRIASNRFSGLSRVARHRLVHDALGDLIGRPIHAISLTAIDPHEQGATVPPPPAGG
jgi:BolA protein